MSYSEKQKKILSLFNLFHKSNLKSYAIRLVKIAADVSKSEAELKELYQKLKMMADPEWGATPAEQALAQKNMNKIREKHPDINFEGTSETEETGFPGDWDFGRNPRTNTYDWDWSDPDLNDRLDETYGSDHKSGYYTEYDPRNPIYQDEEDPETLREQAEESLRYYSTAKNIGMQIKHNPRQTPQIIKNLIIKYNTDFLAAAERQKNIRAPFDWRKGEPQWDKEIQNYTWKEKTQPIEMLEQLLTVRTINPELISNTHNLLEQIQQNKVAQLLNEELQTSPYDLIKELSIPFEEEGWGSMYGQSVLTPPLPGKPGTAPLEKIKGLNSEIIIGDNVLRLASLISAFYRSILEIEEKQAEVKRYIQEAEEESRTFANYDQLILDSLQDKLSPELLQNLLLNQKFQTKVEEMKLSIDNYQSDIEKFRQYLDSLNLQIKI